MTVRWEVLLGAIIIAASILFIGRYTISAVGYGAGSDNANTESVYRLDRWTGQLEDCQLGGSDIRDYFARAARTGHATFNCGAPRPQPGSSN